MKLTKKQKQLVDIFNKFLSNEELINEVISIVRQDKKLWSKADNLLTSVYFSINFNVPNTKEIKNAKPWFSYRFGFLDTVGVTVDKFDDTSVDIRGYPICK